jgi:hypothetical protein
METQNNKKQGGHPTDKALQAAEVEIREVLKRHDLTAMVTAVSKRGGVLAVSELDASWTFIADGEGTTFDVKPIEQFSPAEARELCEQTVMMLVGMDRALGHLREQVQGYMASIAKRGVSVNIHMRKVL